MARNARVVGVREDGANDFFRVSALAENLGALGGMSLIGKMLLIRPAFVVEVVKESGNTPDIFIGAMFARIGADAGFNGEHVFAKAFRLSEFAKKIPGIFTSGHPRSPSKKM